MPDETTAVLEAQIAANATPPIPTAEDDPMMAGLMAAAKKDQAAGSEIDKAFADAEKKASDATQRKQEPVKAEAVDDKPKLKINPPGAKQDEQAQPAEIDHELDEHVKVPERRADWDKFRADRNKIYQAKKQLEAKVKELESKVTAAPEFEKLKSEHEALVKQYKEASIVNDPSLTADIDEQLQVTAQLAKGSLPADKAQTLESILRMPMGPYRDKAMEELLDGVPTWQQGVLSAHVAMMDRLGMQRDSRLQNAKQNADTIIKQRQAQAEAEKQHRVQRVEKVFGDVTNEFKSRDGFKDLFGNPEIAKVLESEARNIYAGGVNDEAELARKAYHAAITPILMHTALEMARENEELQATVSKLRGLKPSATSVGSAAAATAADSDPFSVTNLMQAMKG